jgi:exonuclease VII small subunit
VFLEHFPDDPEDVTPAGLRRGSRVLLQTAPAIWPQRELRAVLTRMRSILRSIGSRAERLRPVREWVEDLYVRDREGRPSRDQALRLAYAEAAGIVQNLEAMDRSVEEALRGVERGLELPTEGAALTTGSLRALQDLATRIHGLEALVRRPALLVLMEIAFGQAGPIGGTPAQRAREHARRRKRWSVALEALGQEPGPRRASRRSIDPIRR